VLFRSVNGIATLLFFATNFPVGITVLFLNAILLFFAWRTLGGRFTLNSIICVGMLVMLLSIGQMLFTKPIVPNEVFMSSIIGAALAAFGTGIAITFGGNSGGMDILALIIGKYRNISYGRVTLYSNILIISSLIFVPDGSVNTLVYSLIGMFVYIYVSDLVIEGYRQSFQYFVFSTKNEQIADQINEKLNRGATFLKAYGSYSKEDHDVLLIVAHRTDRAMIIKIIKEIDDAAFISVAKTSSVFGKNFDKIKV
jgi:uncharacterized membrane-anchored protein YitT (DUF2179 family)